MEGPEGPYIQAAVFCEKVLKEADGVLSIIRIVDRFTTTAQGAAPPEKMPPLPINLVALITLKPGMALGRYKVTLRGMKPSRQPMLPGIEIPVRFEGGENRGQNVMVNVNFQADEEGIYWFDVLFGERLLTRMPLELVYQPVRLSSPNPPPGS
jgi:hypothetical protein